MLPGVDRLDDRKPLRCTCRSQVIIVVNSRRKVQEKVQQQGHRQRVASRPSGAAGVDPLPVLLARWPFGAVQPSQQHEDTGNRPSAHHCACMHNTALQPTRTPTPLPATHPIEFHTAAPQCRCQQPPRQPHQQPLFTCVFPSFSALFSAVISHISSILAGIGMPPSL